MSYTWETCARCGDTYDVDASDTDGVCPNCEDQMDDDMAGNFWEESMVRVGDFFERWRR